MQTFEINGKTIEMEFLSQSEAAKRIKKAMKKITGKIWSVTQGKGTSSYITVTSPPSRKVSHIENPNFDFNNRDYYYRQRNESCFDYSQLDKNLKRSKHNYSTSKEDGKILASIFGDVYKESFLVSPDERCYIVYLLENYEEIQAEKKALEEQWENEYQELMAKKDDTLEQNEIKITEDMIEEVKDNTAIITVAEPKLNKCDWLDEYIEQYNEQDYRKVKVKVKWQLNLTNEQYDEYIYQLMSFQDAFSGKSNVITTDDGFYYEVIKVVADDRGVFYIGTQGHDYARYVYLPLSGCQDMEEIKQMIGVNDYE